jgi:signal transduction histidine kinase
MEQNLKAILDFILQSENLTTDVKDTFSKTIKDVDKELAIISFKLDRTEKVKRTTAILLEETIEELEQKRKAVEAQNRELEVEAALERVRTVALSMQNPAEMVEVCSIISEQLEFLKVKDIRNVQTAVIYESKGTYINYEYYARHDKLLISEVSYKTHHLQEEFALRMLMGEYFSTSLKGQEVKDWYKYQQTTNQFADSFLEEAKTLNYYMFSLGPVALGISTYSPLIEEEINLFKRFRNVFELAYRRFLDIQKAEAQAREAQIELALERVRAGAMAMRQSAELSILIFLLYQELTKLDAQLDRCFLMIVNLENKGITWWMAGQEGLLAENGFFVQMNEHPSHLMYLDYCKQRKKKWTYLFQGKEKRDWDRFGFSKTELTRLPEPVKAFMAAAKQVHLSGSSDQFGSLVTGSFEPLPEEQQDIISRFTIAFNQAYIRFLDLQKAEAQAREAQIEVALERVRSRTMAMFKSEELSDVAEVLFTQVSQLGKMPDRISICVIDEPNQTYQVWATDQAGTQLTVKPVANLKEKTTIRHLYSDWKAGKKSTLIELQGAELKNWIEYLRHELGMPISTGHLHGRRFHNVAYFSHGWLNLSSSEPVAGEVHDLLQRFASVFSLTYTRFLDLQKAEAQAREAQIEAALERIRSRALAMHKSSEVGDVSDLLFSELEKMDINPTGFSIMVFDREQDIYDLWRAKEVAHQGVHETFSIKAMYDKLDQYIPGFARELELQWNSGSPFFIAELSGKKRIAFLEANREMGNYTKEQFENVLSIYPDPVFWQLIFFKHGWLGLIQNQKLPENDLLVIRRFADVFEFAHTRFLDLQKAEAHALQAEEDLIAIKAARQRAEVALAELQVTQKQLIQSEKMASLGELTAGIAHEIQNPLNFVNNFSEVSTELVDEMKDELAAGNWQLATELADDVKQNLEKINHHGKRAADIVKGMLQHSRNNSGTKEPTNINTLADEYLRLAYHGLRAKDKSFNATMKTDFDESIGTINIIPQDIGRVILNLITNAFYAVTEKKKGFGDGFDPTVSVRTKRSNDQVLICVSDNGSGIPQKVLEKIFQPFFTTKPTGQGTGLGLSLAYDIVKAHGGELKVETKEGEGTIFIIHLPNHSSL